MECARLCELSGDVFAVGGASHVAADEHALAAEEGVSHEPAGRGDALGTRQKVGVALVELRPDRRRDVFMTWLVHDVTRAVAGPIGVSARLVTDSDVSARPRERWWVMFIPWQA